MPKAWDANLRCGSKAAAAQSKWDARFTPKADIRRRELNVRFVPIADIPLITADVRPAFHRKLGNGADT
jgi:hypothetical protein